MSSLSSAVRDLQRELENKTNDLSKLQKDIAKNHQVRKKYTVQLGENELVLKELDLLNEDANVYKLIGPVLVKQDLAEANSNVRKRIEYITAELKRLDATVQDLEEKQNSKKDAVCTSSSMLICVVLASSSLWFLLSHLDYTKIATENSVPSDFESQGIILADRLTRPRYDKVTTKYLFMGGASSSIMVHSFSWLYGSFGGEIELQEIVNDLINT
ncbi:hypothetical protein AHAS_Ahas19G0078900 [Arachis hypogaea]